jgi:hypothetical protein
MGYFMTYAVIGRENELNILEKFLTSSAAESLAIYGRRMEAYLFNVLTLEKISTSFIIASSKLATFISSSFLLSALVTSKAYFFSAS